MALPRAGRGFNLKTRQRRTLYLYPFSNGDRSPEPWVVVAPPDLNRVKNIPKYSGIFQNIQKHSKIFKYIPKCSKIYQEYFKIFRNIPKYSGIFQ